MTILSSKHFTEHDEFQELLIKNLPAIVKGGNEKHTSNIYDYPSITALKKCKFIHFNSREQISFMVFDIDKAGEQTALEYFKSIEGFLDYIAENIGLEPTFITQTEKGFHFAYHLKNHVYTFQPKAVEYLKHIKRSITCLLQCDEKASHRLNGIWRNPLKHIHYYSGQINYALSDFSGLLQFKEAPKRGVSQNITIDENELNTGNRNEALFRYAMKYAKGFKELSTSQITNFLIEANAKAPEPLNVNELYSIASSVFKYWKNGTIAFGELSQERNINEGIMNFPKMKYLPYDEYVAETKHRQRLSALRTNAMKNINQLDVARAKAIQSKAENSKKKVAEAIEQLKQNGEKINVWKIAKITKMDRMTVKKYFDLL